MSTPIQLSSDCLTEVLSFFNRDQLEQIMITNRQLKQLAQLRFPTAPYRLIGGFDCRLHTHTGNIYYTNELNKDVKKGPLPVSDLLPYLQSKTIRAEGSCLYFLSIHRNAWGRSTSDLVCQIKQLSHLWQNGKLCLNFYGFTMSQLENGKELFNQLFGHKNPIDSPMRCRRLKINFGFIHKGFDTNTCDSVLFRLHQYPVLHNCELISLIDSGDLLVRMKDLVQYIHSVPSEKQEKQSLYISLHRDLNYNDFIASLKQRFLDASTPEEKCFYRLTLYTTRFEKEELDNRETKEKLAMSYNSSTAFQFCSPFEIQRRPLDNLVDVSKVDHPNCYAEFFH